MSTLNREKIITLLATTPSASDWGMGRLSPAVRGFDGLCACVLLDFARYPAADAIREAFKYFVSGWRSFLRKADTVPYFYFVRKVYAEPVDRDLAAEVRGPGTQPLLAVIAVPEELLPEKEPTWERDERLRDMRLDVSAVLGESRPASTRDTPASWREKDNPVLAYAVGQAGKRPPELTVIRPIPFDRLLLAAHLLCPDDKVIRSGVAARNLTPEEPEDPELRVWARVALGNIAKLLTGIDDTHPAPLSELISRGGSLNAQAAASAPLGNAGANMRPPDFRRDADFVHRADELEEETGIPLNDEIRAQLFEVMVGVRRR